MDLRDLSKCITDEINKGVNQGIASAVRRIPAELRDRTKDKRYPSASGSGQLYDIVDKNRFANSMIAENISSPTAIQRDIGIGNTAPYTDVIEDGQDPGTSPNADQITGWVGRTFGYDYKQDNLQGLKRRMNDGDADAREQFFHVLNVSRKIFERGLEGRQFFALNGDNMLDILEEELIKAFS